MKTYNVVVTPEAEEHLVELYSYIEENASAEIAVRYMNAVVSIAKACGHFRIGHPRCPYGRRRPARHNAAPMDAGRI